MCKFSSKSGGVPFQPLGDLTWNDPNISARIWNVLSNKINCDVSMSIFKCNLKLFLLNNELVLNYPK